jgi:putative PIN family toxin of toxin-antitoxin system
MRSAVLDTSVIVSALLMPAGPPAAVVDLGLSGVFRWYVTDPIRAEYGIVLARKRLGIDTRKSLNFFADLYKAAILVTPTRKLDECTDASDNKFLECALEARADFVVTGNTRHFPTRFQDILIVNPRQFLTVLAADPR